MRRKLTWRQLATLRNCTHGAPSETLAAAADGTHFETHEDNLLAEQHIRYGKTRGIAYRHIADNYIALFSRFIRCGTYKATYILDALLQNLSDLHPKRVHADTHCQSAAVFGLAYLLGIELMPRIRRRRNLRLYPAERDSRYRHIDSMFSGTVSWAMTNEHYPQLMQLALAIQGGALGCARSYQQLQHAQSFRTWLTGTWESRAHNILAGMDHERFPA